jgi:choline transport protein
MVWSMIFCSVTSFLAAIMLLWTAGNWEEYMLGTLARSTHTRCLLG